MSRVIVIILPVADLAASTRFYEALGCSKDETFSDDATASMDWSDLIAIRLMTRDSFASFSSRPLNDPHTSTQMQIALPLDSREAVDSVVETAARAGGKADVSESQELDYMYGRSFEDPDGHVFWAVWMKSEGI